MKLPRGVIYVTVILVALSLLPLAVIAVARNRSSSRPRLHVVPNMDAQESFKAQQGSTLFADGRAMRAAPAGTLAQGELYEDEAFFRGRRGGSFIDAYPKALEVDEAMLLRGRQRFDIYCAPCHGYAGQGDGMVSQRALKLAEGSWVPPSNLTAPLIRTRPLGQLYETIANGVTNVETGVRTMPAYGPQIPVADRWAIVAYIKALQLSQGVQVDDLPAELRQGLR